MANLQIRPCAVHPEKFTFVRTKKQSISLFTFLTFLSFYFIPYKFCVARQVESSTYFFSCLLFCVFQRSAQLISAHQVSEMEFPTLESCKTVCLFHTLSIPTPKKNIRSSRASVYVVEVKFIWVAVSLSRVPWTDWNNTRAWCLYFWLDVCENEL